MAENWVWDKSIGEDSYARRSARNQSRSTNSALETVPLMYSPSKNTSVIVRMGGYRNVRIIEQAVARAM